VSFSTGRGKTAFGNMSCTNCGGAKAPPFYIFPAISVYSDKIPLSSGAILVKIVPLWSKCV
jgi:hypothetical protein